MGRTQTKRRKKAGRPRLSKEKVRETRVNLRFTESEAELLRARANGVGQTLAAYIRDLALS